MLPLRSRVQSWYSTSRTALFGLSLSLPTPSNLPLAGTGAPGSGGPPWLLIAKVVVALPAALWIYKSALLVLLQRRIIYLPSVPPGTRNESLEHGARSTQRDADLAGLAWRQVAVESSRPSRFLRRKVTLHGIELEQSKKHLSLAQQSSSHVVIVYLQGNAGTPLLRLPLFRRLLLQCATTPTSSDSRITLLSVAPRSFWTSSRAALNQEDILSDYATALAYARRTHPSAKIILYGHSLGGAASILLLQRSTWRPCGLILENPLPSIPFMVKALYPQRWLPYHYLGPFVFDRWDALGTLTTSMTTTTTTLGRVPSLWIRSSLDEIIPTEKDGVRDMWEQWRRLGYGCEGSEGDARWVEIGGALHDTAFLRKQWSAEVQQFIERVAAS